MRYLMTSYGTQMHLADDSGEPLCGRRMTVIGDYNEQDRIDNPAPVCRWCLRVERHRTARESSPKRLDTRALREAIEAAGGPDAVGARSNVSGRVIRYWLESKSDPGVLSLARVCGVVGIPLESVVVPV